MERATQAWGVEEVGSVEDLSLSDPATAASEDMAGAGGDGHRVQFPAPIPIEAMEDLAVAAAGALSSQMEGGWTQDLLELGGSEEEVVVIFILLEKLCKRVDSAAEGGHPST